MKNKIFKTVTSIFLFFLVLFIATPFFKEKAIKKQEEKQINNLNNQLKEISKQFKEFDEIKAKYSTVQDFYDCAKKVNLGNREICLPEFKNMKECSENSNVKRIINNIIPNGSLALGYYINDKTYQKIDLINDILYDDYFLVFTTNILSKHKITKEQFEELSGYDELLKKSWDKIDEVVNNNIKNMTIDKPVILDKYSINENIISTILMSKIQSDNNEIINITISSSILIKDKILFTTYNKHYSGTESVKISKNKNDYFVLRILQDNE